jgi:hypothetical protein
VLYNKKAMEQAVSFVAETMEPLDVRTKRPAFEVLSAALWNWYSEVTPERNLLYYIEIQELETAYTDLLKQHFKDELVTFGSSRWTIHTFLEHFTPGRYNLRARDPQVFKARLSDIVALVVRDFIFLEKAEQERLGDNPEYQRNLVLWKKKWMFQEFKNRLLDPARFTDAQVKAQYEQMSRRLNQSFYPYARLSQEDKDRIKNKMMQDRLKAFVDSVSGHHAIEIFESVLDTLSVNVSTKNPFMTVHLLKNNSNKMPFPIVDPNWKLDSN